MFDSGFLELLVVMLIALIVVGPERLPGIARKVGEMVGKARAFVATTKADIEKEIEASEMKDMLSQQKEQIDELRNMMASTKQSLNESTETLKNSVTDVVVEAKSDPSTSSTSVTETTDTLDAPNTTNSTNTTNTDISDSSKSKS
ncbi:MAG TPA: twin-arginine translocase subunit TatB [Thiothrix sp.]|nr:twin-arginine translocase subunit TatB [Thiothrix sp.]